MRLDEAKVREAFNALVPLELTEAERLRLVRAILADLVEESLGGVQDAVLCVAEGLVTAAGLALEPATQFFADIGPKAGFVATTPLEPEQELPQ